MTVKEKCLEWLPTLQGGKITQWFPPGGFSGRSPLLFSTICFILQMGWSQFPVQEMATEGRESCRVWTVEGGTSSASVSRKQVRYQGMLQDCQVWN